ncbi:MAG: hypothetical protein KJ048_05170 [Dehalococcoidia bacterium]|nr:hypothetical protein [Dehalococcoidia bacterium]
MNRLSSLITAGLTTGLSAAALGATATAQGVFGGGDTASEDTAAVQQVAEATTDATAAAAAATATESPTPRIVYVDKEPIVVTRQVQVPGTSAPASPEGAGGAAAGGTSGPAATPSPSATSPSTPAPAAAPPQVRSAAPEPAPGFVPPPVQTAPAGSSDVSTAGTFDDNGGATPRDNRFEAGDDRDDGRDDDDDDDDGEDREDREDREDDDDDD